MSVAPTPSPSCGAEDGLGHVCTLVAGHIGAKHQDNRSGGDTVVPSGTWRVGHTWTDDGVPTDEDDTEACILVAGALHGALMASGAPIEAAVEIDEDGIATGALVIRVPGLVLSAYRVVVERIPGTARKDT